MKTYIFLPFHETRPRLQDGELQDAMRRIANIPYTIDEGDFTIGCHAASLTFTIQAREVIGLEGDKQEEAMLDEVVRPLGDILGRDFYRATLLCNYAVADRLVQRAGEPDPVVYKM